jgi:sirohydrochlorin ferrochelatase
MKSLLLVAHGSRRQASNDEVRALTQRLAQQAGDGYGYVDCGFLELAEPSIPDGIQRCIDAGADEVVVLPYFLSKGRHVVEDIPAEVRLKQAQYPNVAIRISAYLGEADGISELLLSAAKRPSAS